MRKKSLFNNKYLLIALFVLLIGGVSVGFALISSYVQINGKAKIGEVKWDVHFTNVDTNKAGNVTLATGDVAPNIDASDDTKASWTVTLTKPGDQYSFSIDVENGGTLDAKLTDITADSLTAEQDVFLNYTVTSTEITGQDPAQSKLPALKTGETVTADPGETLVLKAGKKYRLNFTVAYDSNIEAQNLPTGSHEITLNYKLDFEQNM